MKLSGDKKCDAPVHTTPQKYNATNEKIRLFCIVLKFVRLGVRTGGWGLLSIGISESADTSMPSGDTLHLPGIVVIPYYIVLHLVFSIVRYFITIALLVREGMVL